MNRPVECAQCKKPAKVIYKEVVGNAITCTTMCRDCPILEQKWQAKSEAAGPLTTPGLCCERCKTALDDVRMGAPLGCGQCYAIFGDAIVNLLIETHRIPNSYRKSLTARKNQAIHVGKTPEKPVQPLPTNQLSALNAALNEALKKEQYEEAAKLRDQIKDLLNKKNE